VDAEETRRLAASLFNGTWELLERPDRSPAEDDRMVHMAHASRFHWEDVGTPANIARGEWQCSRVYAVLGRAEPALHHAQRVLTVCQDNGIGDFDLGYAYEALARAHAVAGNVAAAREWAGRAREVVVAEEDDRELLIADIDTIVLT
jgi:hypothetical protein